MSEPRRDRLPSSPQAPAGVAIRGLTLADVELAAALHALCFEDAPWKAGAFADLLAIPGTFGFLAHGNEEPYGLLLCRAVAEDCEILTLGVVPARRRYGVGRDLLRAGLRKAKELGALTVFLEVAVDNTSAVSLYRSAGFDQAAVRRGYYRRKDPLRRIDALVLSRAL